jgi:hypothetical protein
LATSPLITGLIAGLGLAALGLASVGFAGSALAQSPSSPADSPRAAECPPSIRGVPPTVGGPPAADLSDRLAESKGVICPPAGVDPEIQVKPPAKGEIKIIPPPSDTPEVTPK